MIDIVELLYRQYKQLRDEAETLWDERYDLRLTSAEWNVINNIYLNFHKIKYKLIYFYLNIFCLSNVNQ